MIGRSIPGPAPHRKPSPARKSAGAGSVGREGAGLWSLSAEPRAGGLAEAVAGGPYAWLVERRKRRRRVPDLPPWIAEKLATQWESPLARALRAIWGHLAEHEGYAVPIGPDGVSETLRPMSRLSAKQWAATGPRLMAFVECADGRVSLKAFARERTWDAVLSHNGAFAELCRRVVAEATSARRLERCGLGRRALRPAHEALLRWAGALERAHEAREADLRVHVEAIGGTYAPVTFDFGLLNATGWVKRLLANLARRLDQDEDEGRAPAVDKRVRAVLEVRLVRRGRLDWFDRVAALVFDPAFFLERYAARWGSDPPPRPG